MKFKEYLNSKRKLINRALDSYLPKAAEYPQNIHKAMRYALTGGKRIRPILTIAASGACGGEIKDALPVACAIELIHTYSLIHDDLPAIDNDDYRRNRPTCHKKFSEAIAILAGDGLLTLAFNILTKANIKDKKKQIEVIKTISEAIGTYGLLGGEAADISLGPLKSLPELEYINSHKTGALITAAVKTGAIITGASDKKIQALQKFGERIGFAFQIVDDILDNDGYTKMFGNNKSYIHAKELIDNAKGHLAVFDRQANHLKQIADYILTRKF